MDFGLTLEEKMAKSTRKGNCLRLYPLIALLLLFYPSKIILGQINNIDFKRISIEQGLSQSSVQAIVQDHQGFLWFATQDGLNQYDGYEFKVFKHEANDSSSISDDWVSDLCVDKSGDIWIGTAGGGLNRYDKKHGSFVQFEHVDSVENSLSDNRILSLFCDSKGTVWVGTDGGGLNKYNSQDNNFEVIDLDPHVNQSQKSRISYIYEDKETNIWLGTNGQGLICLSPDGKIKVFSNNAKNSKSISSNQILTIYEDNANVLWIGTDRGLNSYSKKSNQFRRYLPDRDDPYSISDQVIYDIYEDENKVLWIATDGGLNLYHIKTNKFWTMRNEASNPLSISNDLVRCIYAENSGTIWVGTYGGGLNQYNWRKRRFNHYRQMSGDPNSLHDNTVWAISEDNKKNLWLGTNKGIACLNRANHTIEIFRHDSRDPKSLSDDIVRVVYEDHLGTKWFGTTSGGLNRYNPKTKKFDRFMHDPSNNKSLSNNTVRAIFEDHQNQLWIGTWSGLNKFDRKTETFTHYKNDLQDPTTVSDDRIRCLAEDEAGTLWVGTYGGLNKLDKKSGKFVHYLSNPNDKNSLSHDRVLTMYCDSDNIIWIGTYGGGLNKFDAAMETFTHYTEEDGLSNNAIYGILEDDQDKLWVSTNRGISCYNKKTDEFKNYDINDGLQSNEFNGGAFFKNKSGEMFFGGINGFNSFMPNKITENKFVPPVVVTSFKVFDREINLGQDISLVKNIELSFKQNFFSFEFAALDFTNPEKNHYAYFLEGFDVDWNQAGSRRYANYTNLSGGEYVFRVKGSNGDGIWNEEGAVININIIPPFWATLWFRILAGLLIIGTVYGTYHARMTKVERQKRRLQKEIKQRTQEIQERNVELIQSKRQTDNILKNVAEGIFLVNTDFKIESQYSAALEGILAENDLGGKDLLAIIENRVAPAVFTSTKEYLELMFDQGVDEVTLNDLNPLTRIEYYKNVNGSISENSNFLGFKVQRVIESNKIRHLIMTVSDLTRQIKLASELEESESRTKQQMEWLVSILHIEAPMLQDFIDTVSREVNFVESILRDVKESQYKNVLDRVNKSIGLIKSNASMLDLKYFMNSASEFSERVEDLRNKEKIQGTDFVPLILKLGEMKRTLQDINNLIDRIGQIRTFFRPKRKYENQILISSVQNLIHNLSEDLDKEVELKHDDFNGEDIPYKHRILVKDVMVELIRNAICHGIETSEERKKVKKQAIGVLELRSERENSHFCLVIRDDGRGIQEDDVREKIRQIGYQDGLDIDNADLTELLFALQISSSDGRNNYHEDSLGLKAMKKMIEENDGKIEVRSENGKYCEFKITIPV
jgi:ligand-binding sensor domain-containing protein/signal transduction histidine kinase